MSDSIGTPVLYVVPLNEGQPDLAAQAVIHGFAASGLKVVTDAGRVDEVAVGARAAAAGATAILLCADDEESFESFRPLVVRVRDDSEIFDVLAVGRPREDAREGDRGEPFFIHPSEGERRIQSLAQFVARGTG